MVDEQDAVQMVDFMLQAGGKQPIGFDNLLLAVTAQILHGDGSRTLDLGKIIGNGQATLFIHRARIRRCQHLRVQEHLRLRCLAFLRQIDHQHATRHTHLNSSQPDARRIVHCFQHVVRETQNLGIDSFHRARHLAQQRIRKDYQRFYRHGALITDLWPRWNSGVEHFYDAYICSLYDLDFVFISANVPAMETDRLSQTLLALTQSPYALPVMCGVCVLLLVILLLRGRTRATDHAGEQMDALLHAQAEMQGRIAAMADVFSTRQAELNQSINQRIDGMTHRIGTTLTEQTKTTHDNLRRLQERLAVIDTAQNNIQTLAKDVVGLQAILSNKQTRGAFGQSRMETIIADALPMHAYAFQTTLSNGSRPDCTIRMPNGQPALVVDAKFPLEAWNAIRAARDAEAAKQAAMRFRRDLDVHIKDIATKYLIPGETQETAFLFVPSESVFADIHERFESIVQSANRARVVIVSPSLLMLSIQVIQSILRDQRMREQAHLIQGEVIRLMEDLTRLDDRVRKLQGHFSSAQKDVEQILTSSEKMAKRGSRIEAMEFETPSALTPPERSSQVKLRVVDDE